MPDHPDAAAKLRTAVRDLYAVFGRFKGESNWDDGLDNLSPERASRPERLPVKELSREDVEYFFWHAVCLADPRNKKRNELHATRYFLPRVFEFNSQAEPPLDATGGCVTVWWFLGERLRNSQWHNWPADQRIAIMKWFGAWLDSILMYLPDLQSAGICSADDAPRNRRPDDWIEAAAELDLETAEFVARLDSASDRNTVSFVCAMTSRLWDHPTRQGFIRKSSEPSRQQPFVDWLLSRRTADRLEKAFFDCNNRGVEWEISKTLELLEGVRASLPFLK